MTQPIPEFKDTVIDYSKAAVVEVGAALGGIFGGKFAEDACGMEPMMTINAVGEMVQVTKVLNGQRVAVYKIKDGVCGSFFQGASAFVGRVSAAVLANHIHKKIV